MISHDSFRTLFSTYCDARDAYLRLEARGPKMSDRELARDADYRTLFVAGRRLVEIGGRPALDGAIRAFFPADADRTERARSNLDHWWAGFGIWEVEGQRMQ